MGQQRGDRKVPSFELCAGKSGTGVGKGEKGPSGPWVTGAEEQPTGEPSGAAVRGITVDLFHGMGEGGKDHLEVFPNPSRASGKIHDQACPTDARDGSGDHCMGRLLKARGPHGLRHAGHLPVEDGAGSLGGDVPR